MQKIYIAGKIKLSKAVNKDLVTVKPCQSNTSLKLLFALLLGALPRGWKKFVKSNARPSGPYTLCPSNFFGKITKKLPVDCARDS